MKKFILSLAVLAAFLLTGAQSYAQSLIEEDYAGFGPKVTTPWYEYYSPQDFKIDQDYITGMRPHHAGALTMSEKYLNAEGRSSARLSALAGGIIRNQTFEILMLDTVQSHIKRADFSRGAVWHQVATKGLAQRDRFMRSPTPPIQRIFNGDDVVSATDVLFAKAMIVHHEGALMMARDYLGNPDVNNGYLERMNLDVLRDQAQEIALMHNIIAAYPGDQCAISITPDMIDGMDDMMSHMDFSSVNCTAPMKMACCDGMDCCKDMKCCKDGCKGDCTDMDCKCPNCCCKDKGAMKGMKMGQCPTDMMGDHSQMKHEMGHKMDKMTDHKGMKNHAMGHGH